MRVCILEWICGGGLYTCNPENVSQSLIEEGWAMLRCLCQQFSDAGHRVATTVDQRIAGQLRFRQLSDCIEMAVCFRTELATVSTASEFQSQNRIEAENKNNSRGSSLAATLEVWRQLAVDCDLTIVVAPEIEGILEACVHGLIESGIRVANCTGELLKAACDKWLTAQYFQRHQIPHPMTWPAGEFHAEYSNLANRWCVKPCRGAGCEGLRILDSKQLVSQLSQIKDEPDVLIQAWREGQAFSCSAIVDFGGRVEWMPLVTQEFTRTNSEGKYEQLGYIGAHLASPTLQAQRPVELLNRALGALASNLQSEARGWIGFDLAMDEMQNWTVIEVNTRLTTSAVELCRLNHATLASQMLKGYNEFRDVIPGGKLGQ